MQARPGQLVKVAHTGAVVRVLDREHGRWLCGDGGRYLRDHLLPASEAEAAAYRARRRALVTRGRAAEAARGDDWLG
jgi:hypothetical protein